jgi:hypothetical protein
VVEIELVVELPDLDAPEVAHHAGELPGRDRHPQHDVGAVLRISGDLRGAGAEGLPAISLAKVLELVGLIQVCFSGGGSPLVVAAQEQGQ